MFYPSGVGATYMAGFWGGSPPPPPRLNDGRKSDFLLAFVRRAVLARHAARVGLWGQRATGGNEREKETKKKRKKEKEKKKKKKKKKKRKKRKKKKKGKRKRRRRKKKRKKKKEKEEEGGREGTKGNRERKR